MERLITNLLKKSFSFFFVLLLELLQIMSVVSDSCPSVLSLRILFCAIFPNQGSCTIAKTDSYYTSWELHTDKLNIQPLHPAPTPPPSPWHASVATSIGTAVQLSPQPASQPLSKATSVETEHTRAACRSLLIPTGHEVCQAFWLRITTDRINRITGF